MRLFLMLVLVGLAAGAPRTTSPRWTSIAETEGFAGWRQELRRIASAPTAPRRSTFCVVVDRAEPEDPVATVYWREGRTVFSYGRSREPMSPLTHAGPPIDLRRDVVARPEAIAGSTFRETSAWVRGRLNACRRFGRTLTLVKGR